MKLTILFHQIKSYRFLIILLSAIFLGALSGYFFGAKAIVLKPLSDIFINLMFTIVVPLVFFSVSSALAKMQELTTAWIIIKKTLGIFLLTSTIAAIFMLTIVQLFPFTDTLSIPFNSAYQAPKITMADQLVSIFTASDFLKLFSRENMLALIIFSALIGIATASIGKKGELVANFLQSGADVSMKAVSFIMYYAPIGFFAYFAVLVGEFGQKILGTYFHAVMLYYVSAILYFFIAFTIYAYWAAKKEGIKLFWQNIFLPTVTALATCSSAASMPANLQATKQMKVPPEIYELAIPLGTVVHKDGSVLGGIVKIAFLFGIFHLNFDTPSAIFMALSIGVLVGTVMGAIPSGGLVGETLILSAYGFPPESLLLIAAISMLIDPPATVLNVTSNSVCSMMITKWVKGPAWASKQKNT